MIRIRDDEDGRYYRINANHVTRVSRWEASFCRYIEMPWGWVNWLRYVFTGKTKKPRRVVDSFWPYMDPAGIRIWLSDGKHIDLTFKSNMHMAARHKEIVEAIEKNQDDPALSR